MGKLNLNIFILMLSLLSFIISEPIKAQNDSIEDVRRTWISLGAGLGKNYYVGVAGVSFQKNHHLFTPQLILAGNPDDGFLELSMLYGVANSAPHSIFSISGGPSLVSSFSGERFGRKAYFGLSLSSQASIRSKHVGIGLYALANINKLDNNFAITIIIQAGKLK